MSRLQTLVPARCVVSMLMRLPNPKCRSVSCQIRATVWRTRPLSLAQTGRSSGRTSAMTWRSTDPPFLRPAAARDSSGPIRSWADHLQTPPVFLWQRVPVLGLGMVASAVPRRRLISGDGHGLGLLATETAARRSLPALWRRRSSWGTGAYRPGASFASAACCTCARSPRRSMRTAGSR